MKDTNGKTSKDVLIACGEGKRNFEIVNPLDEIVKIKGKKVDIKIFEDPDGFSYLIYKNHKYQVDILEKNQNKYTIMVNGVWYYFSIETPISFKRRKYLSKSVNSSKIVKITAPMPGKILDILVEENSDVKQGEAVIILEAMKMQNEILAQISGKVKKVNIKTNDSVMKDDILIEIERS
ncbi:MAG: biotin attachment protein [Bacteroidales bacterium]|nr:biotin attachment protein [Bacteroidales bacterium]MCB9013157.1 biotin attachment protein [Bacteroidales bacterium]